MCQATEAVTGTVPTPFLLRGRETRQGQVFTDGYKRATTPASASWPN